MFHCCTYPVLRLGSRISAPESERGFGRVSTGAAGSTGNGGAVPTRTSLPAAELGNRVEDCEKPGVAPSTELAAAPTTRSLKIPCPPRIAVLPSPHGSHEKPKRGAKLVQLFLNHLVDCWTVRLSA